jgi:hypothetical protein
MLLREQSNRKSVFDTFGCHPAILAIAVAAVALLLSKHAPSDVPIIECVMRAMCAQSILLPFYVQLAAMSDSKAGCQPAVSKLRPWSVHVNTQTQSN